ncbi:hypothetical protein SS05631_c23910 [Sinorhizobium sp. CCBAU 05631]|nr:hypothetical protein SS05631_c23910 [Sinorhizobium sp. CCBAU 05631]
MASVDSHGGKPSHGIDEVRGEVLLAAPTDYSVNGMVCIAVSETTLRWC